jgi:flagellar biosynthetic protein FliP
MKRLFLVCLLVLLLGVALWPQSLPTVTIQVKDAPDSKGELATTIKLALLFTLLTLLPAILLMTTSFTRIIITFHFLRQAIGIQGMPPNQVLIGLSLFLTLFIMAPVGLRIQREAIQPMQQGKVSEMEALKLATFPLKDFMLRQTREKDLALFYSFSKEKRPATKAEVGLVTLIPAFALSELKTAFQIGFLLYIPFLIIDIVVASILVSLGMIFLPPIMVSLPFKVVLFILADGWALLIGSLLQSFHL